MAKNDGFLRITLNVPRISGDYYFSELASLPPYQRAKRVHALARMALAIERGQLIVTPANPTSNPIESGSSVRAPNIADPQTPSDDSRAPSQESSEVKAYTPALDELWDHGIMGNP
jgi:hypothetical protein